MSELDRFGAGIAVAAGPALAAWNEAAHAILVHGGGAAEALARVRAADPSCAIAGAVQGLAALLAGRAELVAVAHDAAAVAAGASDRRGRAYADALRDWLAGRAASAAARLEACATLVPDDVLAVKLAHQIRFMAGDAAGMASAAERALAALPQDHPGWGYVAGCAAFAREERRDYAAAERLGRVAVERNADDMWAIHAVAHVHEMRGRAADGARWLAGSAGVWTRCGNFRFHLWWHQALFALRFVGPDLALALYDRDVRAERTDDYRDVANAVSLLARLELKGVDVGSRWEELAEIAARRIDDDRVVFARLHYLLALLRAGRMRDAARLIDGLRRAAIRGASDMDAVARVPGLAIARALQAAETGRPGEAARLYAAAAAATPRIGGSNAQRALFDLLAAEAERRCGASMVTSGAGMRAVPARA